MKKRKYSRLCAEDASFTNPAEAPLGETQPQPQIHNVVATAFIVCSQTPIPLQTVAEAFPFTTYDTKRFAAITIRLSEPNCTALLFTTGKLVVTGGKNWYECLLCSLKITGMLSELFTGVSFWVKNCEIQNIVGHVEIPLQPTQRLDIQVMYSTIPINCTYQKNMFPGLIFRPESSPVVLICFLSGKIVITGGKSVRDIHRGWARLWPTVRLFVK